MLGFSTAKLWAQSLQIEGDWRSRAGLLAEPAPKSGESEGILAGTLVAVGEEWHAVETLKLGDLVTTFDHGPQPLKGIRRLPLWTGSGSCPLGAMPLAVPQGALGNSQTLLLLPDQGVLVESDLADAIFDDPFALIPAAALEGFRGIERVTPHQRLDVYRLEFEGEELVYANGTGMIHCPVAGADDVTRLLMIGVEEPLYRMMPLDIARRLVEGLEEEWGAA
ncbi:Hint domain-containing protein [Phaeovulum sp. W22_SRMD_FR3]|uniref:Hint domain-containing protein n=1 Tax=Phaeovulum sp. W22_SRMD_FR3 TaxID=3240274 RepID=UPI003F978376